MKRTCVRLELAYEHLNGHERGPRCRGPSSKLSGRADQNGIDIERRPAAAAAAERACTGNTVAPYDVERQDIRDSDTRVPGCARVTGR